VDSLYKLLEKDETKTDLQHYGWTAQEILEEYGDPSRVGPSPNGVGNKWYYELAGGKQIVFWFVEGRLSKVIRVGA